MALQHIKYCILGPQDVVFSMKHMKVRKKSTLTCFVEENNDIWSCLIDCYYHSISSQCSKCHVENARTAVKLYFVFDDTVGYFFLVAQQPNEIVIGMRKCYDMSWG